MRVASYSLRRMRVELTGSMAVQLCRTAVYSTSRRVKSTRKVFSQLIIVAHISSRAACRVVTKIEKNCSTHEVKVGTWS
jgi:hypothetical protein